MARKAVPRLGVRIVPMIGLAIATAGMIDLTQLPVHGHYAANLLPGLLPIGLGMGATFVPLTLAGSEAFSTGDGTLTIIKEKDGPKKPPEPKK